MPVSISALSRKPVLSSLTSLVLISLASCARAEPPELFVADPNLINDFTENLPTQGSSQGFHYQIIQGVAVLQGDIILGPVNARGKLIHSVQRRGVGRADTFGRWPDGIVPYQKPPANLPVQRDRVEQAVAHWNKHTRITFVERTDENAARYPHYIAFQESAGCASFVGRSPGSDGSQPVMLSEQCSVGSVIHELGHAIGFYHEHTRADRDNFVTVNHAEIQSGKENNFAVLGSESGDFDSYSPYDYGSIMHYGEFFFAKGRTPTISVPGGVQIGQREALSELDILAANNMYATDLSASMLSQQSTEAGVELVMSIENVGSLGAHAIELLLRIGDDTQWLGVSAESGWNCVTFDSELNCTRETLRENSESRFVLLVDPKTADIDDLAYQLSSRTLDTDPSNNNHNNAVWISEGNQTGGNETSQVAPEDIDSSTSQPSLGAAAETDSASGGAAGTGLLSMLLASMGIAGIRRRKLI